MLQILIVRHANPIYDTDSITEEGEQQAVQLAERITRLEKIDALYVSPLGRAIRTAEHISKVESPDRENTICLVCHAGTSIVILSHLLQWHLPLAYAHIGILETGIARILFKSQGENDAVPVLISLNDVSHFDDRLWKRVVNRQKNHKTAM